MELDDVEGLDGDALAKVSKKKPVKVEESKSKKEHVNVVFIGHVGGFFDCFFGEVVRFDFTQGVLICRCRQIHHRWPNHVPHRDGRQADAGKVRA